VLTKFKFAWMPFRRTEGKAVLQVLGLILVLINVGAIAAPITAVVLMHQSNLVEIIVPPEVAEIVASTFSIGSSFTSPQLIDSEYIEATRTIIATFSFTNPVDFELSVNSLSADVQCSEHIFMLGSAGLKEAVQLNPDQTTIITVVFTWTEAAETHFETEHAKADNISIDLVYIAIDVSGINIEIPEHVNLNVPIVA
jgi:LEA14-like dessication related protein